MIDETINNKDTVPGGGKDVILAGRYHILRQLGKGGMGAVWLAEDRQLDNRKVAVKMLPTIVVKDKRAYQQLKSEALVSLKLVHPNIVTLRAFEENNGAPFLVMDYIEGQTLSDYLAIKGKLSEAETIKLLNPIAAALDYAHSEKVIHRDVKPSNIIIRKDGHPFILDFGIAREIQESMTRVTGRTISGTLLYMSPEQLRGAPPAPAQDVYSFAAMAYECLKGEPPFIRGEIAYQIINEQPAPLEGGSQLVVSIMAGLAKNPEDRPKCCMAVVGKIDPFRVSSRIDLGSRKENKGGAVKKMIWTASIVLSVVVATICCLRIFIWVDEIPQRRNSLSDIVWDYLPDDINGNDLVKRHEDYRNGKAVVFAGGATYADEKQSQLAKKEFSKINECFGKAIFESGKALLAESSYKNNPIYYFFKGVLAEQEKDFKAAHRWYQLAAEEWCKEALFNLGVFYEFGIGVAKDATAAAGYYQRAAEMGDAEARIRYREIENQDFGIPDAILLPVFKRNPWPDSSVLVKGTEFAALRDDVGRWWDVPFFKVKDFFEENANQVDGKFFFICSASNVFCNIQEISRDRLKNVGKEYVPAVEKWNGEKMYFVKANDRQAARNIVLYYILVTGKDAFTDLNSGGEFEQVVTKEMENEMANCKDGNGISPIHALMTEELLMISDEK